MLLVLLNQDINTPDTVLTSIDTLVQDSVISYSVPEIVKFHGISSIDSVIYNTYLKIPSIHEFSIFQVLKEFPTSYLVPGPGLPAIINAQGKQGTSLFLNGHYIGNLMSNHLPFVPFTSHYCEEISLGNNQFNEYWVNLTSKINRFRRPYSCIKYSTGTYASNLYNIDFSRPLSDINGLYISGQYWESQGNQPDMSYENTSLYGHLYEHSFIPLRLDLFYINHEGNIPFSNTDTLFGHHRKRFIDASLSSGNKKNKFVLFYTAHYTSQHDTMINILSEYTCRNYGLENRNYYSLYNNDISFGIRAILQDTKGEISAIPLLPNHLTRTDDILLWTKADRSFGPLLFSTIHKGELFDRSDLYYSPAISCAIKTIYSSSIVATVRRNYRYPSLAEEHFPDSIPGPLYCLSGNSTIRPEYYWLQEIGVKRKDNAFILFRHNYEDRIMLIPEDNGCLQPINIQSCQTTGAQFAASLDIQLEHPADTHSSTTITGIVNGTYLFTQDTMPLMPQSNAYGAVSFTKETDRLGFCLKYEVHYVGDRRDYYQQQLEPFLTSALHTSIRFITLTFSFQLDNLLNRTYIYYPEYTMPGRNLKFIVQWEFWD